MFQELFDRQTDVFCDLTQQDWRNISSAVHGNRCAPTIGVPKLFVLAPLTDLRKAQCFQDRDDLAWFENPRLAHAQPTVTVWVPMN